MTTVKGISDLLRAHPFFTELDKQTLDLLAGCAVNKHAHSDALIFRAGEAADQFFVVRHGRVALELSAPGTPSAVLDTVDTGEVVGWSWLVPPYRWYCDARAVDPTDLIAFDAECLRTKCRADPALGYELMQRVTQVMYKRLQAARVRLLDLYGAPRATQW
jgi:CRP-like cAMP-binding protein